MRPHEHVETARLLLRRPTQEDADAIFNRYAKVPEVTTYLTWPTHRSLEDKKQFLTFSDGEWERWPIGPYLIHSLADGLLLGCTGLRFKSPAVAETGYVFARDAWGQGFATEATLAIIAIARAVGVQELRSSCHVQHAASKRVLEKCGFILEAQQSVLVFPNLGPDPRPTLQFSQAL